MNGIISAKQFEKKLERQKDRKVRELEKCREIHFITKTFKIVSFLSLYGAIVYIFMDSILMFMPIYRSDFC